MIDVSDQRKRPRVGGGRIHRIDFDARGWLGLRGHLRSDRARTAVRPAGLLSSSSTPLTDRHEPYYRIRRRLADWSRMLRRVAAATRTSKFSKASRFRADSFAGASSVAADSPSRKRSRGQPGAAARSRLMRMCFGGLTYQAADPLHKHVGAKRLLEDRHGVGERSCLIPHNPAPSRHAPGIPKPAIFSDAG